MYEELSISTRLRDIFLINMMRSCLNAYGMHEMWWMVSNRANVYTHIIIIYMTAAIYIRYTNDKPRQ